MKKFNFLLLFIFFANIAQATNQNEFFLAIKTSDLQSLKMLLNENLPININAYDVNGDTALISAIKTKNIEITKLLIDSGASVSVCSIDDISMNNLIFKCAGTQLTHAINSNVPQIVALLIDHGVDINACDKNYFTPLMLAARKGSIDVIKLLLEKHENINVCDKNNNSALYHFLDEHRYRHSFEIIQLFIHFGANVTLGKNSDGKTILGMVVSHLQEKTLEFKIVSLLIENGADVNACDQFCWTALMSAACSGKFEIVKLLLENGANVHVKNLNDKTALQIAQSSWHLYCDCTKAEKKGVIKLLKAYSAKK